MASNRFGEIFTITTWGESHGKAIGVIIDGCPAGIVLDPSFVDAELKKRAPGKDIYTSPRKEPDKAEILSGVFEGKTTGTPISILIWNKDADSSKYEPIKNIYRPGHANFSYQEKYGIFDYRGGGRASARETACRVAAGAVAKQLLKTFDIFVKASLKAEDQIRKAIEKAKKEGTSLGGVVEFQIDGVPAGLGDPIYQKLDARLASAMMSIPAAKGVEIGSGMAAGAMRGSEHNDLFIEEKGIIKTETNHSGGVLGGISNGMPIVGKVAFKPTSSITQSQKSVDSEGKSVDFKLPEGSRHDPCVALRASPIVEAMAALVIADALLMNRSSRL